MYAEIAATRNPYEYRGFEDQAWTIAAMTVA
jgi:hypothetical protein